MGFPFFIPALGSQLILGAYARIAKRETVRQVPTRPVFTITALIPCKNESKRLPYALASLARQTRRADKVVIIDDGSTDNTFEVANLMKEFVDLNIEVIRREKSIGKTPSLKMVVKTCGTDKLLIFDADTILEDNYIEKIVIPHYDGRVSCSYGIVKPLSRDYKRKYYKDVVKPLVTKMDGNREELLSQSVREFSNVVLSDNEEVKEVKNVNGFFSDLGYYINEWSVVKYREALYSMDQYFVKDTQMRMFNTTLFPIGCGVLYDVKKLRKVFDKYESSLGDNLTTSEDIFVGFEFCNTGYVNCQVKSTHMWTTEPKIKRLTPQLILWSSSFIQSAYYFGNMTKRFRRNGSEKPFGLFILPQIFEKVTYPLVLVYMACAMKPILSVATLVFEFITFFLLAYFSTPAKERNGLITSIVVAEPIRLMSIPVDFYILYKFCKDLVKGNRNWRK
jgi:glycosyltransferase involved in cell wall biosynthesis